MLFMGLKVVQIEACFDRYFIIKMHYNNVFINNTINNLITLKGTVYFYTL